MIHTFEFIETKGVRRVWTGKTDKNGIKIYDGDILLGDWLRGEKKAKETVVWDDGKSGFYPFTEFEGNMCNSLEDNYFVDETCEVIGNILE
jgi:hypothetical protein